MSEKGFTLVELLAVIVILAVILAIAVPSVSSIIEASRVKAYEANEASIIKATRDYLMENGSEAPQSVGDISYIQLSTLISNQYLNDVLDPKDKTVCNSHKSIIKVEQVRKGEYEYEAFLTCNNYTSEDTNVPMVNTRVSGNQLTVKADDNNNLYFSGTGSQVQINYTFPQTLTIEAWGYGIEIGGKMMWSFTYGSGPALYFNNILTLNLGDGNSNPFGGSTTVPIPPVNEWHHYAVVFDKTNNIGRLYLDGVDKGTATYKSPVCSKLYIGHY
ncbi:MAG: LamG-like jellyroll fold domain-containing protein, partial [Bacilli bacterium]